MCNKEGMWNDSNGTTTAANSHSLFWPLQRMYTIRSWTRRGKTYTTRAPGSKKKEEQKHLGVDRVRAEYMYKLKADKRSESADRWVLSWNEWPAIWCSDDKTESVCAIIIFDDWLVAAGPDFWKRENGDDREIVIEAINYNFRDTVQRNIRLWSCSVASLAVALDEMKWIMQFTYFMHSAAISCSAVNLWCLSCVLLPLQFSLFFIVICLLTVTDHFVLGGGLSIILLYTFIRNQRGELPL